VKFFNGQVGIPKQFAKQPMTQFTVPWNRQWSSMWIRGMVHANMASALTNDDVS
jgi:hypothetical protein